MFSHKYRYKHIKRNFHGLGDVSGVGHGGALGTKLLAMGFARAHTRLRVRVRFARLCFNNSDQYLTAKLLKQGYRYR